MARLAHGIDYVAELLRIREAYILASPAQRLRVIRERLADHHFGPNRLVTSVSAVEALARCLVTRQGAKSKTDVRRQYQRYRKREPTTLIEQYLKAHRIADTAAFFGEDNWQLFRYAVDYRNLLAHECTYLGLDKFPSLISACEAVVERLAAFAKL